MSEKFFKYLILICLVITFVIILQTVFLREKPAPSVVSPVPKIEVNFQILDSERIGQLLPFLKIEAPTTTVGRENPFKLYK